MARLTGPDPVSAGQTGAWTVELEATACQAVTTASAQGGIVAWARTTAATTDGTIRTRKLNNNNEVLVWTIGAMAAGDVRRATLTVNGTVGRKLACGTLVPIASTWSATANAGAGTVQSGEAGPVTVGVCTSAPPPPLAVAPVATNDAYSLAAGATLTIPAATGLLANDVLGSPAATLTAVLGGDGLPLGTRTILNGTVAVDAATGSFTLTGATRAGIETFSYDVTSTSGTSRGVVTITVTPGAAATMVAHLGEDQTGTPGSTLPVAPAVRVSDAFGNVIAAADVTFAVTGGGGSGTGLVATTSSEGIATVGSWTLGGTAGANTLDATATGLTPVRFTAAAVTTCTAGAPATIGFSAISGASVLRVDLEQRTVTVLVTDACGTSLPDVPVTWSVAGGSISQFVAAATTGADGKAAATWQYFNLCGTNASISASVAGLAAVTHTITFRACGGGGGGGSYQ
jgi:adhesin/invasin